MKPTYSIFALSMLLLCSCQQENAIPLTDQLKKVWSANVVKEGGATVFTKGVTANAKPGYSQFRLDLTTTTSAD